MNKVWILIAVVFSQPVLSYDFDAWSYNSGRDKVNDEEYSYAYSRGVNYRYNDNFSVGFYCKNGKVRFEISADTLIQSKGRPFSFTYRVDKRPAQEIKMNTYSNEGQGGYTYDDAVKVANDIFGGSSIFVRAITWNNEYLETNIPLKSSDSNIKKVFSDCGKPLGKIASSKINTYKFSQFKSDFDKLSVKKQNEILAKIEKMVRAK